MFKLDKFMKKESANKLRGKNLHKLASVIESNRGEKVSDSFALNDAITLIGKKAYLKSASYNAILKGLQDYKKL